MRELLCAAALLLVLAVPALAASSTAKPGGGVRGTVKQPTGGTCLADGPCDGVGRNVLLVFSHTGRPVHRVRSNGDGAFRVVLAPGRYTVRAVDEPAAAVSPGAVTVPAKGFAHVTLVLGASGHRISTPGR